MDHGISYGSTRHRRMIRYPILDVSCLSNYGWKIAFRHIPIYTAAVRTIYKHVAPDIVLNQIAVEINDLDPWIRQEYRLAPISCDRKIYRNCCGNRLSVIGIIFFLPIFDDGVRHNDYDRLRRFCLNHWMRHVVDGAVVNADGYTAIVRRVDPHRHVCFL